MEGVERHTNGHRYYNHHHHHHFRTSYDNLLESVFSYILVAVMSLFCHKLVTVPSKSKRTPKTEVQKSRFTTQPTVHTYQKDMHQMKA